MRSEGGFLAAAGTNRPVADPISGILPDSRLVLLDPPLEIADIQCTCFGCRARNPESIRGLALFSCAAANPNIEVQKRAGSLDGIYKGGVKSGIGAGSGGVI
jgi:hypothetical protein